MKTRVLALTALGLWAMTILATAVFLLHGQTVPTSDGRKTIRVSPDERHIILKEMRGMLTAAHGIVIGLTQDDVKAVATAARAAGISSAVDISPRLMAKLPLEFEQMGMKMHVGFDALASAAEAGETREALLARLGAQLGACVACHEVYSLRLAEGGQR
jgi:cytochrome c556